MRVSLRSNPGLRSPSETERAVFGSVTSEEIYAFLNDHARKQLGSGIARIRFRAGRIDAVWGVELANGRAVVIKTHRPPADLEALRASQTPNGCLSQPASPAQLLCPDPRTSTDVWSRPKR